MIRTQVQLTEEQVQALRRLAEQKKKQDIINKRIENERREREEESKKKKLELERKKKELELQKQMIAKKKSVFMVIIASQKENYRLFRRNTAQVNSVTNLFTRTDKGSRPTIS